jgi:hypothetical protein
MYRSSRSDEVEGDATAVESQWRGVRGKVAAEIIESKEEGSR